MDDFWSLLIFVLLLLAIVLMVLYPSFSNKPWIEEGFVAFEANTSPLDTVIIPQYAPSTHVYKLYDNFFFDIRNGNLIQINGLGLTSNDASGNVIQNPVDNIGTSISSIVITKRNSSLGTVVINTLTNTQGSISNAASSESQISGYTTPFSDWMIASTVTNTDNYQVLYIAWLDYTFIDVIDNSVNPPTYLLGALFHKDGNTDLSLPVATHAAHRNNIVITSTNYYTSDTNDGVTLTQPLYHNRPVYQITPFLQFDTTNGNLLVVSNANTGTAAVQLYDRRMNKLTGLTDYSLLDNHVQNVAFSTFSLQIDPTDASDAPASPKYFIYYIAFETNTIVTLLQKVSNTTSPFQIVKTARFDNIGYVSPSSSSSGPTPVQTNPTQGSLSNSLFSSLFGNLNGGDPNDTNALLAAFLLRDQMNYIDNNYIPKSQIVPPVFPVIQSCPACSSGGVCTNCGGSGGSGTLTDASNNSIGGSGGGSGGGGGGGTDGITSFSNNLVNATTGLVNNVVDDATDLTKMVVGDTVGLVKDGVSGTADLGREAVSGATSVVNSAVGGTVGLGREVVGGTVGLGRDVVGGTVGLTNDAVNGTANIFGSIGNGISGLIQGPALTTQNGSTQNGTQNGQPVYYSQGSSGQPPYTMQPGYTSQPIQYNTNNQTGSDGYSYYGTLPDKGSSDFLPLTASFSAFGK